MIKIEKKTVHRDDEFRDVQERYLGLSEIRVSALHLTDLEIVWMYSMYERANWNIEGERSIVKLLDCTLYVKICKM